jgi:Zn-dependent protease with chaperone function
MSTLNVSARDRQLMPVTLGLGLVFWLVALVIFARFATAPVVVGLLLGAVLVVAILGLSYLFAHSAFIAHLRGQGIEVTESQLTSLHAQIVECCTALGVAHPPRLFVLNGNGVLNAFATWFLNRRFIILNSDVVDAMDGNPAGVRFYIGHELGHILRHDNPFIAWLRWPALRLPLLGAAFARARESTCDLHGLACCPSRESAARSVAALAAGKRQWAALSVEGMRRQVETGTGFWMSFHELISSYPWTAKRTVRVLDEEPWLPQRNPFAYLLAGLIPYAGRMGAGIGLLLYVYVIGIGPAIMIPRLQSQTQREHLAQADTATAPVRDELVAYYQRTHRVPASLDEAHIDSTRDITDAKGVAIHLGYTLDARNMALKLYVGNAGLLYVPKQMPDGSIRWSCSGLDPLPKEAVPATCLP